jgi:hypothetical protein
MESFSERRKKLVEQNKKEVEIELSPQLKAKRIKRLKDLLKRIKSGEDITRRDLQNALTKNEWDDFENANQYQSHTDLIERPKELDRYIELLRLANLSYQRAETTPVTDRTRRGADNSTGKERLYKQAEREFETALTYLYELLEGNDKQLAEEVRLWLDRDVNTALGHEPSLDPQSVPRVKGSRSQFTIKTEYKSKYDIKRENKINALVEAIERLKTK